MTCRRRTRAARLTGALVLVAGTAACTVSGTTTERTTPVPTPGVCRDSLDPGLTSAPQGDLPGWTQVFTDDFDRCDLGPDWGTYSGQPGGNPHSWWDASMVSVEDDVLRLRSRRDEDGDWVTGGVSNHPVTQTYGRWEIRMRAQPGEDISYHMLLWPQDEVWPPEIDFAESVIGDRSETTAFLHWVDADGRNDKKGVSTDGDFASWHTVGVEWGPGIVRFLLDGEVWSEAHSDEMVPDVPMWLALQAEAGACERRLDWGLTPCADDRSARPDSVAVEVDWVSVYAPNFPELETMYERGDFDPSETAIQFTDD